MDSHSEHMAGLTRPLCWFSGWLDATRKRKCPTNSEHPWEIRTPRVHWHSCGRDIYIDICILCGRSWTECTCGGKPEWDVWGQKDCRHQCKFPSFHANILRVLIVVQYHAFVILPYVIWLWLVVPRHKLQVRSLSIVLGSRERQYVNNLLALFVCCPDNQWYHNYL